MFFVFGNLDYTTVFSVSPYINQDLITLIGLGLLIGAMAKSAQIGLHNWLPTSMEGPTPVSALLHAACLVTAGVYLLVRSSPLLEYSSTVLLLILWVGSLTAFFAATTGLFQNDIKRIIAYSTVSQLGYMFVACGLSQFNVAIFHLINHAFFKALLFLAAGAVIHALQDEQDLKKFGRLITLLPLTYTMVLIGSLSLMALPFLTGFYSKDTIIESTFGQYQFSGLISFWFTTASAVLTAIYSTRLLYLTFLGYPNGSKNSYLGAHEPTPLMAISLVILAIFSVFFGYFVSDLFIGLGSDYWANSLFIHPSHSISMDMEFSIPLTIKLLPIIGSIVGAIFTLCLYHLFPSVIINFTNNVLGRSLYRFFNQSYYFDNLYTNFIIQPSLNLGYIFSKVLDKGVLEILGPLGITHVFTTISNRVNKLDTGSIPTYALFIVIGALGLIILSLYHLDPKYFILYLITMFFISV